MNPLEIELYEYWQAYTNKSELADRCFIELIALYLDTGRVYHNAQHLLNMLHSLEQMNSLTRENVLACFYHDAVYVPDSNSNELESAAMARRDLTAMNMAPVFIRAVEERILDTVEHNEVNDWDINVFLDADMSILGMPNEEYARYSQSVRKELCMVSDREYSKARAWFINNLLNKDHVFITKQARSLWENQARTNLRKELNQLFI